MGYNKKKDIQVVSGNGKDLNISSVYSHIPASKPKTDKKPNKDIVIPNDKKSSKKN